MKKMLAPHSPPDVKEAVGSQHLFVGFADLPAGRQGYEDRVISSST